MQNEQLVCMAMGYLAGSFLTAVFVARTFTEKEISQIGTGNPGMANVMANIGKKEGVLVLAGDLVKVVIACRICRSFSSQSIPLRRSVCTLVLGQSLDTIIRFGEKERAEKEWL